MRLWDVRRAGPGACVECLDGFGTEAADGAAGAAAGGPRRRSVLEGAAGPGGIAAHEGPVVGLRFSPSGRQLVTVAGGGARALRVWTRGSSGGAGLGGTGTGGGGFDAGGAAGGEWALSSLHFAPPTSRRSVPYYGQLGVALAQPGRAAPAAGCSGVRTRGLLAALPWGDEVGLFEADPAALASGAAGEGLPSQVRRLALHHHQQHQHHQQPLARAGEEHGRVER